MDKQRFYRANISINLEPRDDGLMVIPYKAFFYTLVIDPERRFAHVKNRFVKLFNTLAEFFAG